MTAFTERLVSPDIAYIRKLLYAVDVTNICILIYLFIFKELNLVLMHCYENASGSTPRSSLAFTHTWLPHNRDVGVCQVVSRSDCCVWRGCTLSAWKASFLLQAGTRHICVVEPCLCRNIPILEVIGITRASWKRLSPVLFRLWGWAFFSRLCLTTGRLHTLLMSQHGTRVTVSLDHGIQHAAFPHSCVMDSPNPNTHSMTWSPHLHYLALSPLSNSPTSPGLISTSDGRMEGVGVGRVWEGDWNLRGMVSSLLTGSICKTFPTLLPDTDDSPKHHQDR